MAHCSVLTTTSARAPHVSQGVQAGACQLLREAKGAQGAPGSPRAAQGPPRCCCRTGAPRVPGAPGAPPWRPPARRAAPAARRPARPARRPPPRSGAARTAASHVRVSAPARAPRAAAHVGGAAARIHCSPSAHLGGSSFCLPGACQWRGVSCATLASQRGNQMLQLFARRISGRRAQRSAIMACPCERVCMRTGAQIARAARGGDPRHRPFERANDAVRPALAEAPGHAQADEEPAAHASHSAESQQPSLVQPPQPALGYM